VGAAALAFVLLGASPAAAGPSDAGGRVEANLKFRFRSPSEGAPYECKLDGRHWRGCESPYRLGPVAEGRHRFKVRAISPDGKLDPTPAERRFAVG
jgi:hypothetical protein